MIDKIQVGKTNMVLDYPTKKQLRRTKKDIKRAMSLLSMMSLYEINAYLEPYRQRMAKEETRYNHER